MQWLELGLGFGLRVRVPVRVRSGFRVKVKEWVWVWVRVRVRVRGRVRVRVRGKVRVRQIRSQTEAYRFGVIDNREARVRIKNDLSDLSRRTVTVTQLLKYTPLTLTLTFDQR